jgi:hypothetical protein
MLRNRKVAKTASACMLGASPCSGRLKKRKEKEEQSASSSIQSGEDYIWPVMTILVGNQRRCRNIKMGSQAKMLILMMLDNKIDVATGENNHRLPPFVAIDPLSTWTTQFHRRNHAPFQFFVTFKTNINSSLSQNSSLQSKYFVTSLINH